MFIVGMIVALLYDFVCYHRSAWLVNRSYKIKIKFCNLSGKPLLKVVSCGISKVVDYTTTSIKSNRQVMNGRKTR